MGPPRRALLRPDGIGFTDFLRDTDLLDGVRVVVWVQSEQHMANVRPLRGLPGR
jgi:hypothetical protein